MGRKHCGKRRNCSLQAISLFPTVFSKFCFPGRQTVSLCGNGLNTCQIFLLLSEHYPGLCMHPESWHQEQLPATKIVKCHKPFTSKQYFRLVETFWENVYQYFPLYPKCFQKASLSEL